MQNFSKAYWLDRKRVLPTNDEFGEMYEGDYWELVEQGAHCHPLIAKVGNRHFAVYPKTAVPSGTLLVPSRIHKHLNVNEEKDSHNYLIAKPDTVSRLIELALLVI